MRKHYLLLIFQGVWCINSFSAHFVILFSLASSSRGFLNYILDHADVQQELIEHSFHVTFGWIRVPGPAKKYMKDIKTVLVRFFDEKFKKPLAFEVEKIQLFAGKKQRNQYTVLQATDATALVFNDLQNELMAYLKSQEPSWFTDPPIRMDETKYKPHVTLIRALDPKAAHVISKLLVVEQAKSKQESPQKLVVLALKGAIVKEKNYTFSK